MNKRSTCVQLVHIPTKIAVKCQEERTQEQNRRRARQLLQEKLDIHFNGEESYIMKQRREHVAREATKHAKAKAKLELKRGFKRNHLGIDTDEEKTKNGETNFPLL